MSAPQMLIIDPVDPTFVSLLSNVEWVERVEPRIAKYRKRADELGGMWKVKFRDRPASVVAYGYEIMVG